MNDTSQMKKQKCQINIWKEGSTLLVFWEMQIKVMLPLHLTPESVAIINILTHYKRWWACAENRTLLYCSWEFRLVLPLWKSLCFLKKKKIKTRSIIWCTYFPSWYFPEKTESIIPQRYLYAHVHSSKIYNS